MLSSLDRVITRIQEIFKETQACVGRITRRREELKGLSL